MLKAMKCKNVKITGGVFRERMDLDRAYLAELDTGALLQNFHIEAGIPVKGQQTVYEPENSGLHWGWEAPTCQLRGHFLGHWMSACARLFDTDGDLELRSRLECVVSELARCQKRNGGEWVGSIPEKFFTIMAGGEYIWSPQYTMHKTLMGLVDAYKYAGLKQALDIADRLADWFIKWAEKMQTEDPPAIYKGEQGGMLEIWAELYYETGKDKYLTLIDLYRDNYLYAKLNSGSDALSDDHANASIPLSQGAARMYELTGDEYWSRTTDLFWKNAVTDRGMFATTGANAGEFWIPKGQQAQYLSDNDQEFCTVYNMVRTADYLLRRTGETKYADYIERAIYNGFLAQQNMYTGMPTYFLPLRSGGRKKWGSKTRDFWCCHGTMVQAQTLYPQLIYYTNAQENRLSVMQYIPSEGQIKLGEARILINQTTEMKNYNNQVFFDEQSGEEKSRWSLKFDVTCVSPANFKLAFRVPAWAKKVTLSVDGERTEPEIVNGCVEIEREWGKSTIHIMFGSRIEFEPLPDAPELAAVVDGPVVLAGLTDRDCCLEGASPEEIFLPRSEHTYSTYAWQQNRYVTRKQPVNIEFIPLYEVTDEVYTVYFTRK